MSTPGTIERLAAARALLADVPRADVLQFLIEEYETRSAPPVEPIPTPEATDSDFGAFEQAGGKVAP